jgi:hypothetical protein
MLSLANLTAILWVAGGIIITAALLVGLVLWISHERPTPGLPPAEPEQQLPNEQPPDPGGPASSPPDD